ncbi:MAG0110 family membrane protein [Mycoplasma sp. BRA285]
MNLTRKQEQYENIEASTMSTRTQFYSIMLITFILGLATMLSLSVGISFWFGTESFNVFMTQHYVAFVVLFAIGFVATFLITMFLNKIKSNALKLVFFPILIVFYAFLIAFAFWGYFQLQYDEAPNLQLMPKMIAIMMIPAGVMVVAAILGLFNLINIRVIWIFSSFLFVAFLITFFVSFFVYKADWYVIVIGTALISVGMIIQWWQIRRIADMAEYMDKREMMSQAIIAGIMLFISYAELLWYVISIMSGSRRN